MKFTLTHKSVSNKTNKAVRSQYISAFNVSMQYAHMHASTSAIAALTLKTFLYSLYS